MLKNYFPKWLLNFLTRLRNPFVSNEHFVPLLGLQLEPYISSQNKTALHHLTRYYWARELLKDATTVKSVLDIGCGSGYGSYILAGFLPQVQFLGVDYDKDSIMKASKEYKLSNLEFRTGSMVDWEETTGSGQYDCIISFDTLEHINHRELAMENIVTHLRKEGVLLLSTPCGHEKVLTSPPWPHHKIEYSYSLLFNFLNRYFRTVIGADQNNFPHNEIFNVFNDLKVVYNNRMNPVICRDPILINNPYQSLRQN